MMVPLTQAALDNALRRIFISYCSFGDIDNTSHMSAVKFGKLMRDAGLVGGAFSAVDVDLLFVRMLTEAVKAKGGGRKPPSPTMAAIVDHRRAFCYAQFLDALCQVADKKFGGNGAMALARLLEGHLLPLVLPSSAVWGTAPEDVALSPAAAAALDSHLSTISHIFGHYAKTQSASTPNKGASRFWLLLQQAGALADGAVGADRAVGELTGGSRPGGSLILDQSGWIRLCGHLALCPALLTKAELCKLFIAFAPGATLRCDPAHGRCSCPPPLPTPAIAFACASSSCAPSPVGWTVSLRCWAPLPSPPSPQSRTPTRCSLSSMPWYSGPPPLCWGVRALKASGSESVCLSSTSAYPPPRLA